MPETAYIYDAVRTPRGKGKSSGALHGTKPVDLVVGLIEALRERLPGLDENRISDLVLGIVSPIGDQGMVLPRTAALLAGMPDTVPGLQINRFCGSGLSAVNTAAEKVAAGWDELVLAGGVESMSRVPMGSDGGAWATDPETNLHTGFMPQGIGADLIATLEGFSREDVDGFAVKSQQKAANAWQNGYFAKSIIPITDQNGVVILDRDEHVRGNTSLESLSGLKPSFQMMGEMGFDGVVITDDVGVAKAVADVPVGERATRFVAAGGDIVLTADATQTETMTQALAAAIPALRPPVLGLPARLPRLWTT